MTRFKAVITLHGNDYVIVSAPPFFSYRYMISWPIGAFYQTFLHKGILLNSVLCMGILSNNSNDNNGNVYHVL